MSITYLYCIATGSATELELFYFVDYSPRFAPRTAFEPKDQLPLLPQFQDCHSHEPSPLELPLELLTHLLIAALLREALEEEVEIMLGEVGGMFGVRGGRARKMRFVLESELNGDKSSLLVYCEIRD